MLINISSGIRSTGAPLEESEHGKPSHHSPVLPKSPQTDSEISPQVLKMAKTTPFHNAQGSYNWIVLVAVETTQYQTWPTHFLSRSLRRISSRALRWWLLRAQNSNFTLILRQLKSGAKLWASELRSGLSGMESSITHFCISFIQTILSLSIIVSFKKDHEIIKRLKSLRNCPQLHLLKALSFW